MVSSHLLVLFALTAGVPADGSYEGDVSPARAMPKWIGGSPFARGRPSLIEWATPGKGVLRQESGAPKHAGMYLLPSPFASTSYTVEARFRITRCGTEKRYTYPLLFVITKKGAGYHWVRAGWGFSKECPGAGVSSNLVLTNEWLVVEKADHVVAGKWVVLRLVARDLGAAQTLTVSLDGTVIQEVTTAERSRRLECLYVHSNDTDDAWEIDYIRWKSQALDTTTSLDRPLTPKERAEQDDARLRQKLEELLTGPER